MDFFKGQSKLYSNPKMRRLSPPAFKVMVFSWAWAAENETDGHIPDEILGLIGATPRIVKELVAESAWERNGSGHLIHEWLTYQTSVEELERNRAEWRKRQAKRRSREESP